MALPSISTLKAATRDLVRQSRENGTLSKLTVRIVRRELEKKFALDEGVLDDKEYKTAIKETVILGLQDLDRQEHTEEQPKPSSPRREVSKKETSKPQKSTAKSARKNEGRKRKSKSVIKSEPSDEHPESEVSGQESEEDDAPPPKKKSRAKASKEKPETKSKRSESDKIKSAAIIESSADDESEERKPAPLHSPKKDSKTTPSKRQHVSPSQSKSLKKEEKTDDMLETEIDDEPGPSKPKSFSKAQKTLSPNKIATVENAHADSELSSVIDEPPKKRRKKQKDAVKEQKPEKGKRVKKSKEPLSKDEETVTKLKAMVVACGVRKTWKKEFRDMEKPSQQIKCLHEILGELGMKPRYSMEKAKAIREKRELAQELKDVQEFDQATRRRDWKKEKYQSDMEESGEHNSSDIEDVPVQKKGSARAHIMAFLQDQSDEE